MGKKKTKSQAVPQSGSAAPSRIPHSTLASLRQDKDLWYKICVLIYDLGHMTKDKTSARRLEETTDVQYISAPYFSAEEAHEIKAAANEDGVSIEQAITTSFENFHRKRNASGDFRPCGPHDMCPVYLECFGIEKAEMEDERFISRLRRNGLGTT